MSEICLVHLVWKPLGLSPLRAFLDSYRRTAGGPPHRLVVAFNGFRREGELEEYRALLAGIPHEWFLVSPPAQDIPVYFAAAERADCRHLCFLNSHSIILDEDWLSKLYEHARRSDTGVVGATGSWNSFYSWALYERGEPSAYAEIMADLKINFRRPQTFGLSPELKNAIRSAPWPRRAALGFYYYGLAAPYFHVVNSVRFHAERKRKRRVFSAANFDPFPSPHLRTNAFMISRELMLGLRRQRMRTKEDAYKFESGKQSMTNQILRAGLKTLVVGRDGRGYEWGEWNLSETLWQGEQRNLLVSDNQTRDYEHGDAYKRAFLSRSAWGLKAAPSAPSPPEI